MNSKYNTSFDKLTNYDNNTLETAYKIKNHIYNYLSQFKGIYNLDFIGTKNKIIIIVSIDNLDNKELFISTDFRYELTLEKVKVLDGTFEFKELNLLLAWL